MVVLRHASAGKRGAWRDDDRKRRLDERGRRQAAQLVGLLADVELSRILSSPFLRCIETVEPLAGARGLKVDIVETLAEGNSHAAYALLREVRGTSSLLCTHGDIVPALLGEVASDGVDLGSDPACPKAGAWILEDEVDRYRSARLVVARGR